MSQVYYDKDDHNGKNLGRALVQMLQWRNKGAESGEVCALCKTRMKKKAKVCTGCHATRTVRPKGFVGVLLSIVMLFSAIFSFVLLFGAFGTQDSGGFFLAFLAAFAVLLATTVFIPLKVTYDR